MADQLDLFSAATAPCPHHGTGNVCERCPENYWTDWQGFAHPQDCKGRVPLRECSVCKRLVTKMHWDTRRWGMCLSCAQERPKAGG